MKTRILIAGLACLMLSSSLHTQSRDEYADAINNFNTALKATPPDFAGASDELTQIASWNDQVESDKVKSGEIFQHLYENGLVGEASTLSELLINLTTKLQEAQASATKTEAPKSASAARGPQPTPAPAAAAAAGRAQEEKKKGAAGATAAVGTTFESEQAEINLWVAALEKAFADADVAVAKINAAKPTDLAGLGDQIKPLIGQVGGVLKAGQQGPATQYWTTVKRVNEMPLTDIKGASDYIEKTKAKLTAMKNKMPVYIAAVATIDKKLGKPEEPERKAAAGSAPKPTPKPAAQAGVSAELQEAYNQIGSALQMPGTITQADILATINNLQAGANKNYQFYVNAATAVGFNKTAGAKAVLAKVAELIGPRAKIPEATPTAASAAPVATPLALSADDIRALTPIANKLAITDPTKITQANILATIQNLQTGANKNFKFYENLALLVGLTKAAGGKAVLAKIEELKAAAE